MRKYLPFAALVVVLAASNYFLLSHFNTLIWPYLWPRPALLFLVGFVVVILWLRQQFVRIWLLRVVGLAMIFIGECYVLHSLQVTVAHFSLTAVVHLVGVTGTFVVMTVSYINQVMPRNNKRPPPLPDELPHVAAVIPTYGEPCHVLEKTIVALKQLEYPPERLHILVSDDGHSEEVSRLAEVHGVQYNPGARKDAKAGNLNSALDYLSRNCPEASLILTQDADELVDPYFLKKTVGYLNRNNVAFVQTPKEALTPDGDPFGNRDRIFYDVLQPGRNGSGAAFACGSGVLWRISALQAIGGFSTWNIVEDLTTSYHLHSLGYHSEYHNEILTVGLSPDDIPGLLKQRGTWAADTWRLLLFDNPLLKSGLSIRQRLQYLELGLFYVASAFFIPLLMLTPILSLATGQFLPIEGSALFPWIAISILYYVVLSRGRVSFLMRMWQYWIGHWPTYTKAFWIAVRSRSKKPSYKVTRKTRQHGFYGHLLWPQFLYLIVGTSLVLRAVFWMSDYSLSARITNMSILLYFMFMTSAICRAAFYGITARPSNLIMTPLGSGIRYLRTFGNRVQGAGGANLSQLSRTRISQGKSE